MEIVAAKKESGKKQQTGRRKGGQASASRQTAGRVPESGIRDEIFLIVALAFAVLLFLCNFGVIGPVGDTISHISFGIFGLLSYAAPVLIFLAVAFHLANKGEGIAAFKLTAGVVLVFLFGVVFDMVGGASLELIKYDLKAIYVTSSEGKCGGGVVFGTLSYLMNHFLAKTGTILVLIVLAIICIVIITEKSLLRGVKAGSRRVYESAVEDQNRRRERMERRREEQERRREEEELQREQEEQERILRMDKKVTGVMLDTTIGKKKKKDTSSAPIYRDDMHEIILNERKWRRSASILRGEKGSILMKFLQIWTFSAKICLRKGFLMRFIPTRVYCPKVFRMRVSSIRVFRVRVFRMKIAWVPVFLMRYNRKPLFFRSRLFPAV